MENRISAISGTALMAGMLSEMVVASHVSTRKTERGRFADSPLHPSKKMLEHKLTVMHKPPQAELFQVSPGTQECKQRTRMTCGTPCENPLQVCPQKWKKSFVTE